MKVTHYAPVAKQRRKMRGNTKPRVRVTSHQARLVDANPGGLNMVDLELQLVDVTPHKPYRYCIENQVCFFPENLFVFLLFGGTLYVKYIIYILCTMRPQI